MRKNPVLGVAEATVVFTNVERAIKKHARPNGWWGFRFNDKRRNGVRRFAWKYLTDAAYDEAMAILRMHNIIPKTVKDRWGQYTYVSIRTVQEFDVRKHVRGNV